MNFASLIRARWLRLVLASLLAVAAGQAAAQLPTKPGKYGKTLVADVVLSPSQIDKFAALLATLAATPHGSQNSVMFGDTADWLGDTPAVARSSYIDPRVISQYESDGELPTIPKSPAVLPAAADAEAAIAAFLSAKDRAVPADANPVPAIATKRSGRADPMIKTS